MSKADELLAVHGPGLCHICGKPKIEEGSVICSYPHRMLPIKPVDQDHPEGCWEWAALWEMSDASDGFIEPKSAGTAIDVRALRAENAKLRRDNERLRCALEEIRDYKLLRPGATGWATDIARRALTSEEGE